MKQRYDAKEDCDSIVPRGVDGRPFAVSPSHIEMWLLLGHEQVRWPQFASGMLQERQQHEAGPVCLFARLVSK